VSEENTTWSCDDVQRPEQRKRHRTKLHYIDIAFDVVRSWITESNTIWKDIQLSDTTGEDVFSRQSLYCFYISALFCSITLGNSKQKWFRHRLIEYGLNYYYCCCLLLLLLLQLLYKLISATTQPMMMSLCPFLQTAAWLSVQSKYVCPSNFGSCRQKITCSIQQVLWRVIYIISRVINVQCEKN